MINKTTKDCKVISPIHQGIHPQRLLGNKKEPRILFKEINNRFVQLYDKLLEDQQVAKR